MQNREKGESKRSRKKLREEGKPTGEVALAGGMVGGREVVAATGRGKCVELRQGVRRGEV